MAKSVLFDNKTYKLDENKLATPNSAIVSHLSTEMQGNGAQVLFNDIIYSIDSEKLSAARNQIVAFLQTIPGSDYRVIVNGVEYLVDRSKLSNAISDLHATLSSMGPEAGGPGLYESGSNYSVMITSWDDLIASGAIVVEDGSVSIGCITPTDLPELNEYGFYFDTLYSSSWGYSMIWHADGSFETYWEGELEDSYPAGSAVYSTTVIDMTAVRWGSFKISEGAMFDGSDAYRCGTYASLEGDLMLLNDGSITDIPASSFTEQDFLTGIIIPESVTSIGRYAFDYSASLANIAFTGTTAQWAAITKGSSWYGDASAEEVVCSDGTVSI